MEMNSENNGAIAKEKRAIRRDMRQERLSLPADIKRSLDIAITGNLLDSDILTGMKSIYCFYSTEEEPDTTELMQSLLISGRKVACPRVEKGEINFYYINALTDCCPGFRGICEPVKGCAKAEDKDALVILPGLAFSLKGGRIGYGGGYYDRFLAREPAHSTVALAYAFQVLDSLPCNDDDVRVEYIITPDNVISCE